MVVGASAVQLSDVNELVVSAARHACSDELKKELLLLHQMPQVVLTERSLFDRAKPAGSVAQKRGIICKVLCCGVQVDQKCNQLAGEKACPTFIEATRLLRQKVMQKHGNEECLMKARAAAASMKLGLTTSSTASEHPDAFAAMFAARDAILRARRALKEAELRVEQLRQQESDAMAKREIAECERQEAQNELDRLNGKKQKVNEKVNEQCQWEGRPYSKYNTVEYWRQEESRIYNRRRVQLSTEKLARSAEELKPGGDHGYLEHWRCGLVGSVQYWAEGSKADAVKIVFSLIQRLDLQEALRPLLFAKDMRLSNRRAYICQRIKAALAVTKGCRTKKQWVEHHTILAACMPSEGDNMLDETAEELRFKYGMYKGRERDGRGNGWDICSVRRAPPAFRP